jgi:hypothetical protein
LVKTYNGPQAVILIDQGEEDGFLKDKQLNPDTLVSSVDRNKLTVDLRMQPVNRYFK